MLSEFDSPGERSTMNVHFTVAGRQLIWETDPGKCHIDRAVCDSGWEREFCRIVEERRRRRRRRRTRAYVKNHRLGFEIPYCFGGVWNGYVPDFIVELWEPQHVDNPLCLVVEVKGRRTEQDRAKASHTRKFRLPAVNRQGGFGRWSFVELTDVDTMASDYDEAVSRLWFPGQRTPGSGCSAPRRAAWA